MTKINAVLQQMLDPNLKYYLKIHFDEKVLLAVLYSKRLTLALLGMACELPWREVLRDSQEGPIKLSFYLGLKQRYLGPIEQ